MYSIVAVSDVRNLVCLSIDFTVDARVSSGSASVELEDGAAEVFVALEAGVQNSILHVWCASSGLLQTESEAVSSGVFGVGKVDLGALLGESNAHSQASGDEVVFGEVAASSNGGSKILGQVDGEIIHAGASTALAEVSDAEAAALSEGLRVEVLEDVSLLVSACELDTADMLMLQQVSINDGLALSGLVSVRVDGKMRPFGCRCLLEESSGSDLDIAGLCEDRGRTEECILQFLQHSLFKDLLKIVQLLIECIVLVKDFVLSLLQVDFKVQTSELVIAGVVSNNANIHSAGHEGDSQNLNVQIDGVDSCDSRACNS